MVCGKKKVVHEREIEGYAVGFACRTDAITSAAGYGGI
jgi:hypothetical protein